HARRPGLLSFPTRRSSDLHDAGPRAGGVDGGGAAARDRVARERRGPRLVDHGDAVVRDPRDGVPGDLTGGAAGVDRGIGADDAVAPELRAGDAVAEADAVLGAAVDSVVGDLHLLRGAVDHDPAAVARDVVPVQRHPGPAGHLDAVAAV